MPPAGVECRVNGSLEVDDDDVLCGRVWNCPQPAIDKAKKSLGRRGAYRACSYPAQSRDNLARTSE